MEFEYDPEDLISEVSKRPGLWDYDHPDYRLKSAKVALWRDVVRALLHSDTDISLSAMRELELHMQKKWKGIRDCFTRHMSRPNRSKRPYLFAMQLQFLLKDQKMPKRGSRIAAEMSSESAEEDETTTQSVWRPRKKIKIRKSEEQSEEDNTIGTQVEYLDEDSISKPDTSDVRSTQIDRRHFTFASVDNMLKNDPIITDADQMFLSSLLPHLKSIPEGMRLNAKMQIMKVLQHANNEAAKLMQ